MDKNVKVTKIEATKKRSDKTVGKKRVCAYCRVSTALDEQLESLENQTQAFLFKLKTHPDWENAGLFADEGITGTSVKKRVQFLTMIEKCKEGKIDLIVTKSISRFARNTIDCLNYVRQLKEYGVDVWFEKENIDTSSSTSEMLLTLMASFAQEESRSISENLKWGIRKRFEEGIEPKYRTYGYKHTDDEVYVIVPEEAVIVKEIYTRYVHGETPMEIMKDMMRRGEKAPTERGWEIQQIARIINNERYTGDSLYQKFYIENHLTHKERRNRGEIPQYFIENAHPAIVDKHLYEQAQTIQKMKNVKYGNTTYPYGEMLKCPHCGKTLAHGDISKFYHNCKPITKGAWGCYGDGGCGEYIIVQQILDEALIRLYKEKYGEEKKSVEYYWIDDTISSISVSEESLFVTWKDGTVSSTDMRFWDKKYVPSTFAGIYNNFLERIRKGEIKTFKKNLLGLNMKK